uniref:Uncharacterized protein n=1 Tax=Helianthus annuus TaxID=4232 RepID=A0A251S6U0_HELAN
MVEENTRCLYFQFLSQNPRSTSASSCSSLSYSSIKNIVVCFEDFRGTWVNVRLENRVLFNWIAIDKLGLHIQQAMISCSNGFALDIFRAEIAIYIVFICY